MSSMGRVQHGKEENEKAVKVSSSLSQQVGERVKSAFHIIEYIS